MRRPLWRIVACAVLVPVASTATFAQDPGEQEVADDVTAQVEALLAQAQDLEQQGNLNEADSLLRDAMDLAFEDDALYARAALQAGNLLYWNGATGEGLALLYRAFEFRPDRETAMALVDALLDERDRFFDNGEPFSADSSLQRADETLATLLEGHGAEREVRLRQARILRRTQRRELEGVTILEELVRAEPDDATLHQDLIEAVAAARCFPRALEFYTTLEMERPLWLWYLGQVYVTRAHYNYNRYKEDELTLSDYREAERLVLESARLNPEYLASATENVSYYRAWMGWTHLRNDEFDAALDLFVAALGRFPGNTSAVEGFSHIGQKHNEAGDLDAARELFRVACLWAPERADFWNNYGLFCRDTGHYEEAYAAYQRSMAVNPNDPRTVNDTALILQYHLDRDLDQAEQWLLDARVLSRDNFYNAIDDFTREDQKVVYGDTLVNLWRLYDDQGRMHEACDMVNELRDLDPNREELPEVIAAARN